MRGSRKAIHKPCFPRFLHNNPFIKRVHFFLLFGFNKGPQKEKGQRGSTQEPSFNLAIQSSTAPS